MTKLLSQLCRVFGLLALVVLCINTALANYLGLPSGYSKIIDNLDINLNQPLISSADGSIALGSSIKHDDDRVLGLDNRFFQGNPLPSIDLSTRLSLQSSAIDNVTTFSISQGLPFAVDPLLTPDGVIKNERDKDFTVFAFGLLNHHDLHEVLAINLGVEGQYSTGETPSGKRYQYKGRNNKHLYTQSVNGDHALTSSIDMIYDLGASGLSTPAWKAYAYYDYGTAWNKTAGINLSASVVGAGLSLDYRKLKGKFEVAEPIVNESYQGVIEAQFLGNLSLAF